MKRIKQDLNCPSKSEHIYNFYTIQNVSHIIFNSHFNQIHIFTYLLKKKNSKMLFSIKIIYIKTFTKHQILNWVTKTHQKITSHFGGRRLWGWLKEEETWKKWRSKRNPERKRSPV